MRSGKHTKELRGGEASTTNNRMELTAAIRALAALKRSSRVKLYTDSEYLKKGITEWLPKWKRNKWRTSGRTPVKNLDLWQQLDGLAKSHRIDWIWVKGHSGDIGNERADQLANLAIADFLNGSQ